MRDQDQENRDWRAVWAEHGAKLLLFARQQTPVASEAEDIVQEAFVRYWKARQKDPSLGPSLMFTMLKRIAIDYSRKTQARRAREAEAQAVECREAFFEPASEDHERQEQIEASLRALPLAQREVLVLKVWAGLTFQEIGQSLHISANTAASRYRYAMNQLKQLLTPSLP